MAPRHDYNLRVATSTLSYEVAVNLKPVTINLETDELVVSSEEGNVTLDKLKDLIFAEEEDDEDPEYVESSGESEDSLEYEFENDAPCREYNLRAPGLTPSSDMFDLKPVIVKLEWDQLIVPHEEGEVTLDKLNEFVFEDEEDDEDPEYEESCMESDDSLEYESEDYESDDYSLDELDSQGTLASVVTKSCSDFLKSNTVSWSSTNKAEEYFASFGAGQFGIRLVDSGLSVLETPISYYSSWMSDSVRNTRRHLRAARRAGEKINDSCKSRSLLVHMVNLFPLNAVFDSLGVSLVNKDKNSALDEDVEDDSEYVLSSDDSDDSLEFRSEIESDEDLSSDGCFETAESSDGENEVENSDEIEENSDEEDNVE